MKVRGFLFSVVTILVVITLFSACEDPTKPDPNPSTFIYTVNFEAYGGNPAPVNQIVDRGEKVTEPSVMTRTGYGFGGWYKEPACINEWDFDNDIVTSNITLYAMWDINFHTVDFEANGGNPAPNQENIAHGHKVIMPPAMTKIGYTFAGWYTDAACVNQWNFGSDTVSGNITLYAKWLENFTVTFEADGGNPEPAQQIIANGHTVTEPPAMNKTDHIFFGWYKEPTLENQWIFSTGTVNSNITLYAKWGIATFVPGGNFNAKMRWLDSNAQSDTNYIVEVDTDLNTGPITLVYSGKNNISITLKCIGSNRIVSLNANGSMFTVGSGVTLILSGNLELQGRSSNSASLIRVNSGGSLILNDGASITGNTTSSYGGGVYVGGGTFTMNSGEIFGNAASSYGGGVYVASNGTFTMNSGEIFGNTAISSNSYPSSSYGGGVYVDGTFIMNSGEISGNTASYSSCSCGGGVYVASSGTFTMNSGEISGNTASSPLSYGGGGVYVASSGTFTMNGGEISGNTASSCGGGVYVAGTFTMTNGEISGNTSSYGGGVYVDGTFIMNSGEISGNTASSYGGGVYVDGTFTMSGGVISGNSSSSYGGGVYVNRRVFNKTGGTIFGYSEGNANSNVVKNSSGVVQQNCGHAVHANHSNTIYIMGKDTTSGPGDNLSFDGTVNPPAWSGDWDY